MYSYRSRWSLFLILPLMSLLSSCGKPKVDLQAPPEPGAARTLSDVVAEDLVKKNSQDLYSRLDWGFQNIVRSPMDVEKVLEKMFAQYGQPVQCEIKVSQLGQKMDGLQMRPTRVFWYAVKTTKYPKGKYFLKVEIIRSVGGSTIDVSGFGFLSFEKGTPSYLK
ncbi:MAG TPA: hypothetical protein VIJ93_06725 [bacterium]